MKNTQAPTLTNRKRSILGDLTEKDSIKSISLRCQNALVKIVKEPSDSNSKFEFAEDSFANAISPSKHFIRKLYNFTSYFSF